MANKALLSFLYASVPDGGSTVVRDPHAGVEIRTWQASVLYDRNQIKGAFFCEQRIKGASLFPCCCSELPLYPPLLAPHENVLFTDVPGDAHTLSGYHQAHFVVHLRCSLCLIPQKSCISAKATRKPDRSMVRGNSVRLACLPPLWSISKPLLYLWDVLVTWWWNVWTNGSQPKRVRKRSVSDRV